MMLIIELLFCIASLVCEVTPYCREVVKTYPYVFITMLRMHEWVYLNGDLKTLCNFHEQASIYSIFSFSCVIMMMNCALLNIFLFDSLKKKNRRFVLLFK